jgi:hypothetical protein
LPIQTLSTPTNSPIVLRVKDCDLGDLLQHGLGVRVRLQSGITRAEVDEFPDGLPNLSQLLDP